MHKHSPDERALQQQINHARYQLGSVPYHIISKTLRGHFYLVPKPLINQMIAGIVGRAQHNWPEIKLYAYGFLSNHFHLMLQGEGVDIAAFVGFIKREISRRVGQHFQLPGTFWHNRYDCTALPTAKSQLKCLIYILSQGVKEDLVERPEQWPGIHCAKQLMSGRASKGTWFDATTYGKDLHAARQKNPNATLNRRDYQLRYSIQLSPIPEWSRTPTTQIRANIRKLIDELVAENRKRRTAEQKKVLGVKKILELGPEIAKLPPNPPWYKKRRRMIVAWANRFAQEVRDYVLGYWAFQFEFRDASKAFRNGKLDVEFPSGAWRPVSCAT